MSELNIYQRVNKVMQAVEYVQKDATVDTGRGSYKAVSHDMVLAVLRKEMVTQGIVTRVEQLKSEVLVFADKSKEIKQHLYSGDYAVHFHNMDKPEDCLTVTVNGHAADNQDKAPGKAMSYAVKYAMLKTFGLETGENDEGRLAEDDLSDTAEAIAAATTMEELQATFKLAWHHFPKSRKEITELKDARKKELTP
jgi:hypothetical protein